MLSFSQVVDLVSCESANRGGVVEWPPCAQVLEAAGGVGFGDFNQAHASDPPEVTAEDVMVPPIIRSLHPKLAADAYARHRRDPLFLYKVRIAPSPYEQYFVDCCSFLHLEVLAFSVT